MRRLLAAPVCVALGLGLLLGGAPAALAAASPATVTVGFSGGDTTLTSSTVQASIGDTFVLQDNTAAGPNGFFVRNNSGSVSSGGTNCATGSDCVVGGNASVTLTVTALGTLDVKANGKTTVTLTITGSASEPNLALVYPTATIDANGGTCTGAATFIKAPGQSAAGGSFAAPTSAACSRSGYTLDGWALSSTATSSAFAAGMAVPIGDESFTLFAVWRPVGVQVSYDANVGAATSCLKGGVNQPTADRRSVASVLPVQGTVASSAPCAPPDGQLAGWATTGNGSSAVAPGGTLPASFANGSSHVLYAVWKTTYSVSALVVSESPSSATIVVVASVNGAAASSRVVAVSSSGGLTFAGGATTTQVTTDDGGKATVTLARSGGAAGSVSAAFGDSTASVSVGVARSIVIVGERGTVSGKPGIVVDGTTSGFAEGDVVVPWIRFPGQTTYTEAAARPVIGADGTFNWQRKTGKKTYVYFTSLDGSVRSNSVIIPAK